jgi:hypothetical protein
VTAPAIERPSRPGSGRDSGPAGEEGAPAGDRDQELASAYARGLALHRWHRDKDARALAGQLLLFALDPEDFIQDPETQELR